MRDWCQSVLITVLALTVAGLTGCGRTIMSREEARSEIRSAVSLSAESEMFIDYIRRGSATRSYAEGHARYLEQEAKRSIDDLERAVPEADVEGEVRKCATQLKRLDRELSDVQAKLDNDTALAATRRRMDEIRIALERSQPNL